MNKLGRVRISTAVGYLAPARIRPNLTIQGDSHVRRLLIEDGTAIGVEIERGADSPGVKLGIFPASSGPSMSYTAS